jgi:predicted porin
MMKKRLAIKTVAAASLLALTGAANAQGATPDVQLYGVVDVGISRVTGYAGGSATQLHSGLMEGSRWGIRGGEDLGGGWRTLFVLESRVEADTGSMQNRPISGSALPAAWNTATLMGLTAALQAAVSGVATSLANESYNVNGGANGNRIFDRQAFVGLVTPVGALLAGRQYTPAFEVDVEFDISNTQGLIAANQSSQFLPAVQNRIPNALQYRIVKDGLTASAMLGFGEVAGNSSASRLLGIMAMYKGDGFSVGIGHNQANNELDQDSLTTTVLGASVNIGSAGKLSASWLSYENDFPAGLSVIPAPLRAAFINALRQDGRRYHIGYKHTMGPHTITVAYSKNDDKRPNNMDTAVYGAGSNYAFSKRTDFYTQVAWAKNSGLAQTALGGNGYFGGVTRARGVDSSAVAIGIRHKF